MLLENLCQWCHASTQNRHNSTSDTYAIRCTLCIGVDLAGLLGGRMASAESGSVLSGVGYVEGCPLSSRLWGLGERRELPQRGLGQSRAPAENGFWRILKAAQNAHFVPI